MIMRRTATLLLLTAVLAACGQKGALYIPEKRGEAAGTTVTPVPAPATDAEAEERARQEAARGPARN